MATDIAGGTGSVADTRWRSERPVWPAQLRMCVCDAGDAKTFL